MRYVAMQVLTWGTITGAIGSALLLATLDTPATGFPVDLSRVSPLPNEPTQAGRRQPLAPERAASVPRVR